MASVVVPAGFRLHSENTTSILLGEDDAFLNPVQEFNRDLSVACIRVWSEQMNLAMSEKALARNDRKTNAAKRRKVDHPVIEPLQAPSEINVPTTPEVRIVQHKITILEPLSATGLRSIRYAKEIPLVKRVIANDLSSDATKAITRNVEFNNLSSEATSNGPAIEIVEGDACTLMYNRRDPSSRVEVIDLDPYGTVAPFVDAAVQSISDGGLLCITCTDLAVLATTNYPEKCFSNYGGVPVKAEYSHEVALRLVLHSISTSASRYGRYVVPLLSLSIDFYVRLFIKVNTQPIEVKRALEKTATYYVCSFCQSHYEQPLGRVVEKVHETSGSVNLQMKIHQGPPVSKKCPECASTLHLAGPMWSGHIHDAEFISKVLAEVDLNGSNYSTAPRMKGMLTVAGEELQTPFYFTPGKLSSFFRCNTPSLDELTSALLHAGHRVSRSHACAGSVKSDASRSRVHEIMRAWVKLHPVKMGNLPEGSPSRALLASEASFEADFSHHPDAATPSSKVKLVRYQETPQNWGPGRKAAGSKRKRDQSDTTQNHP